MKTWVLSQFAPHPMPESWPEGACPDWPIAASYSHGHVCPRNPEAPETWALVLCNHFNHEAGTQDPRIRVYWSVWDTIGPETVNAYKDQGAAPGMMLCQLLSLLARTHPFYGQALG